MKSWSLVFLGVGVLFVNASVFASTVARQTVALSPSCSYGSGTQVVNLAIPQSLEGRICSLRTTFGVSMNLFALDTGGLPNGAGSASGPDGQISGNPGEEPSLFVQAVFQVPVWFDQILVLASATRSATAVFENQNPVTWQQDHFRRFAGNANGIPGSQIAQGPRVLPVSIQCSDVANAEFQSTVVGDSIGFDILMMTVNVAITCD